MKNNPGLVNRGSYNEEKLLSFHHIVSDWLKCLKKKVGQKALTKVRIPVKGKKKKNKRDTELKHYLFTTIFYKNNMSTNYKN